PDGRACEGGPSSRGWPMPEDRLQVWGGIECSHVRIGERIRDQIAESGHRERAADLDLVAGLGLARLRHPVIWADVMARGRADFRWHDRRFARMRALGITPVAGLLHHGWGPDGLTPLDPAFAPAFAAFAGAVARRYPWVRDFTPINEPVTTARFSALYGLWHPHARDEATFLCLTFGAVEATVAAMRAIRRVTPAARLIQTEDLGRVFATPRLGPQAEYENRRRFLGFDLLCGRVGQGHPFHAALVAAGIAPARLSALEAAPCPPDIIGIDHYLTSDRWLDDDLAAHPHHRAGGNGRVRYVDVAAAHIGHLAPQTGILPRLREVHARYRLPLAITENHNGCTREEQLRWLMEAWGAARTARREGVEVVAVTSWALFGAIDWNSLLCERTGFYESGAFDLRATPPRLTAVGRAVAALARTGRFDHPVLDAPGWWRADGGEPREALFALDAPDAALFGAIGAACALRRLDIRRAGRGGDEGRLGLIRAERAGGGLRLAHLRQGAERLVAEAAPRDEAAQETAIHAFLDLVIDRATGRFRLSRLAPAGQYRIAPLTGGPAVAPVRAAAERRSARTGPAHPPAPRPE
ncbi:MAG: hypothetical protein RIR62_1184, partial [Pseudomonadota bacterium]